MAGACHKLMKSVEIKGIRSTKRKKDGDVKYIYFTSRSRKNLGVRFSGDKQEMHKTSNKQKEIRKVEVSEQNTDFQEKREKRKKRKKGKRRQKRNRQGGAKGNRKSSQPRKDKEKHALIKETATDK